MHSEAVHYNRHHPSVIAWSLANESPWTPTFTISLNVPMAFAVLLPDQPKFQMPMSLLTLFEMMLGMWDIEQFDGFREGGLDELSALALLVFVLYTVLAVVIAMNLLIAIMGDSYDRVRENQAVHSRIERAEALVAMDWLVQLVMSREQCFPEVLHVLASKDNDGLADDGADDDNWGGRLKELKKSITKVEQNMEASIAKVEQNMEASIKGAEQRIKVDIGDISAQMAELLRLTQNQSIV